MKYCKKAVGEGREFERIRRITGYCPLPILKDRKVIGIMERKGEK